MKKTFGEKYGDMLAHMGKRFLIGMLILFMGTLIMLIPIIGIIGMFFFIGGFFLALSIIENSKAKYIKTVKVVDGQGQSINCGLVEIRDYAYFVIPFVSPYFYIPYRKRYILINNIGNCIIKPGTKINACFDSYPVIDMERVYKKEYKKILYTKVWNNPKKVKACIEARNAFSDEIEKLIEEGTVTQTYKDDSIGIYKLYEDYSILYNFNSYKNNSIGISLSKDEVERFINNPELWLQYIFFAAPNILTTKFKKINDYTRQVKKENPTNEKEYRDVGATFIKKNVITKKMVEAILQKRCYKNVNLGKIVAFIVAGYLMGFAIALTLVGVIAGGIIFLLLALFCFMLGNGQRKKSKKNLKNLKNGNYKIYKEECIKKEISEDSESTDYVLYFNGHCVSVLQHEYDTTLVGDKYYFLSLDGKIVPGYRWKANFYEVEDALKNIVIEK